MSQQIKLYYKNTTTDIIGPEHGISNEQFKLLADKTTSLIERLNEQRKQGETPYRDLPYNDSSLAKIRQLADNLQKCCENFVVLGIGGSALGNIALQTSLNPFMHNLDDKRKGARLFVFDNVDPAQLSSFLDWASDKLNETVFNVISKSGETAETASQFLIIRQMLLDKLGPDGFRKQVVATTDKSTGTLRKFVDETNLVNLEVPQGVGGRFSVLSPVGLLSAAICGIEIEGLLEGARDMDKRVSDTDFYKNPAAINAAINHHCYNNGKRNSVMMPYCYALKDFADWYRQLWAESLGKAKDLDGNEIHVGPTPIKALGTTDQHSQVQLYREGPNDKIFTFLQVENFPKKLPIGPAPESTPELGYLSGSDLSKLLNSEKTATEYALIQDKRPCLTVLFDEVNPYTVGQFIYLFETTTSFAGALFNINTYDQPAVELGKKATFALMGREGYEEIAGKIQPYAQIDPGYVV
jgi:glucose-6-phosphate isomerase